ncbi:protein NRT1/ PTR FAMILY 5.10-like [Papaver somniferum]|uniref:protein NRT1/ PTR FAMILY 5.10-like n=1 Tax=Papaver somniferum TaxID=3469 RepID=UPI000E6FB8E4|nr:protein NRT1/ PTR FAMILY 5.10-like [Papaver somniferum]
MAVSPAKRGNDEDEPLMKTTSSNHLISTSSDTIEGIVDYRGEQVLSYGSNIGGWRSALLIIGAEFGETVAYYGISSNLIRYLTGPLGMSTVTAVANINAWCGMVWMLPLLGAFVADSYLGRYRTIFYSSVICVLVRLGFLTLLVLLNSLMTPTGDDAANETSSDSPPSLVLFFFLSLYLISIGKAGFKPCAEAFSADQFDERNPEERSSKSSFFNWWYFGLCVGSSISHLVLTYIQDNISWVLGFAIPCICMLLGLLVFIHGKKTYRFSIDEDKENPILRIFRVYVASARNWRATSIATEVEGRKISYNHQLRVGAHQLKFLEKALIELPNLDELGSNQHGISCTIDQVEDAKVILRLVPIWIVCLVYAIVYAQCSTFFTKQASTMNRTIRQGIQIPPASLLNVISLSIIIFIPIYDRNFVPLSRVLTQKESGITMLHRIGCGIFLSTMAMVLAALVEKKRLQTALDFGLIDKPNEIILISFWWLVPQYILFGIAEVFAMVGLQEFFYDQVPDDLRSMGLSLYLSIFGIGDFLSGFLIYAINKSTSRRIQGTWFPDNLNRAHLDYFYWFLAGLSALNLVVYLHVSKFFLYRKRERYGLLQNPIQIDWLVRHKLVL